MAGHRFFLFLFFILNFLFLEANNSNLIKTNLSSIDSIQELKYKQPFRKFHYNNTENEFNKDYITKNYGNDEGITDLLNQATAVMNELETTQNYISLLSTDNLVTLPVGVKKDIGNLTYILGISNARFTPDYTEVTAFVKIITPQLNAQGTGNQELFFGANNIRISHSGGIYGDANLVLLGDVAIPINGGNAMVVLKGGFNMQTGDVLQKTYVTVDCNGFKELGLQADVIFPRTMLEPVLVTNSNGITSYVADPNQDNKVTGHFETIVGDWNDIMAEISLPPFQLTKEGTTDGSGKGGLVFELNTAVFDFSDYRNSPDVVFPPNYQNLIPGSEDAWRGVYVNSLSVILPREFKKKGDQAAVSFNASNLLIDNLGVTGDFSVDNILPIHEGEASKWQFSVDHIEASFVANEITEAGFEGKIVLPVTEKVTELETQNSDTTDLDKKVLNYTALMDLTNEEYTLTVSTQNTLSFNVFKAKATLLPNSYIEMQIADHKFKPKAVLHGSLGIEVKSNSENENSKKMVDFKGVTFQNLQLQTESPYFQVTSMGYTGEVKVSGFPVTISQLNVSANDTEASLGFNIDVNLMGENNGFAGNMTLDIVGGYGEDEGISHWQFDHVNVGKIGLDVDLGSIKIDGFVSIKRDDPIYGDGFFGQLHANFNDNIDVTASAMFGKTNIRYWYVDAYADLGDMGITIGPVLVNGFGGGAYYHMTADSNSPPPTYDGGDVVVPVSPSGKVYVPDENAGLGFRALVGFALANKKAFNGKVGFEMAFNTSGGLNRVLFFGEAHIVKPIDFEFGDQFKDKLTAMEDLVAPIENNSVMNTLKETNLVEYSKSAFPQDGLTFDVGIDANFAMTMDFQNHTFLSTMEIYVNTPGNFFRGVGDNGLAGWSELYIAQDTWHLYAGTPTNRNGLRIGVGDLYIETTNYLMMGHDIPGSPPPPPEVASILGLETADLDYMRDENMLGDGRGFALGMNLSIDTGDMTFLIFYANFQAGLGFDIMIKDYGEAECAGSGQIGIDGWYANGQAYVYLQGELGIKIKLFKIRKKIPIISAGAATLLQAKLPNPSWFRGYIGGYYNVLGGLVKGNFRFKVELGEECEFVDGAPLGGLKVISDIKPADGATNIDVFKVPQTAFNMKINHSFELEDDNGIKTYRILLDEFTVSNAGTPIVGDIEWNSSNDVANFVAFDILPPNTPLDISVKVSFQERISGVWTTLMENGVPAQEVETRSFTTGEAPDYIPVTNIEYCYPVIDQKYFYKGERNTGYVKLKMGQPYLFPPETDWTQNIRFINNGNTQNSTNINYNASNKTVNFNLANLNNQQEYTVTMVSIPPPSDDTSSENPDDNYQAQDLGDDNTVEVRNRQAQGNVVNANADETELLTYNFNTSQYDTFANKINDKQNSHTQDLAIADAGFIYLETDTQNSENFDLVEIVGTEYSNFKPLVTTEAVLDDSYFINTVNPLIYQNYPFEEEFTVNRNPLELGVPPVRAVEPLTWYITYLEADTTDNIFNIRMPYRYYLNHYYRQDFYDIMLKIANSNHSGNYTDFLTATLPVLNFGNYKVRYIYTLPGSIQGSSTIFNYIR